MHPQHRIVVKNYLHKEFKKVKRSLHLTQQELADLLELDVRSCNNLTSGRSLPSTVTFILFLNRCCSDPERILAELSELLKKSGSDASDISSEES